MVRYDRIEGTGVLGDYDVLGTCVGRDEGGPFVVVTLVYENDHDAAGDKEVFEDILEQGSSMYPESHGASTSTIPK